MNPLLLYLVSEQEQPSRRISNDDCLTIWRSIPHCVSMSTNLTIGNGHNLFIIYWQCWLGSRVKSFLFVFYLKMYIQPVLRNLFYHIYIMIVDRFFINVHQLHIVHEMYVGTAASYWRGQLVELSLNIDFMTNWGQLLILPFLLIQVKYFYQERLDLFGIDFHKKLKVKVEITNLSEPRPRNQACQLKSDGWWPTFIWASFSLWSSMSFPIRTR